MPEKILKRDGRVETWSTDRIAKAILKALTAHGIKDPLLATRIAKKVEIHLCGVECPDQEAVQNYVEQTLMESRMYDVARSYIIYREKRRQDRTLTHTVMDVAKGIDEYISRADWRINENANMGYSFQGLMLHLSGTQQARYLLDRYPTEVREAHENGYLHIHDLSFGLTGYCAGWSLRDLIQEGFNLPRRASASPAKHLDAIMGQMNNFLGTLQNEWAGAQAFNNVDTYLAPFVRADGLSYEDVKQSMQRFVFNLNTTSRWGGQSPFTNLSFDLTPPRHIAKEAAIVGGVALDTAYGDYQVEMDMLNKAFLEIMLDGDADGRIFSFPIPTYNVTEDFPWESEIGQLLLKLAAKYGAPYFQNFLNSDLKPEDVRSMCCRLRMDLSELKKKTGGLFGAGDLTGSIGVVTINLGKLGYLAQDEAEFLNMVEEYAEIAKTSLEYKRKLITDNMDRGMFQWSRRYLKNGFNGHFSTIGVVGGHEACLNLLGKGIETREGTELMQRMLLHLREIAQRFQEETGTLYNLEASPAEGASHRLARIDRSLYGDNIIISGGDTPYYTNSTMLPVSYTDNVIDALNHQNILQPLYTGGTVFHTFLGESMTDLDNLKEFIVKAMSTTKLPYISITPTFSVCTDHGYIRGEHFTCPECGKDTEVYSRIVGYYRPVAQWNKGKQQEYRERVVYTVDNNVQDNV